PSVEPLHGESELRAATFVLQLRSVLHVSTAHRSRRFSHGNAANSSAVRPLGHLASYRESRRHLDRVREEGGSAGRGGSSQAGGRGQEADKWGGCVRRSIGRHGEG